MAKHHGFEQEHWDEAKREGKALLAACARERKMIPYSDFVRRIEAIKLEPHDVRLRHFLGEISSEESQAGRGMLTALVVHKRGDYQPGPGFFELARQLGHEVGDLQLFWVEELKRVFAAWATA